MRLALAIAGLAITSLATGCGIQPDGGEEAAQTRAVLPEDEQPLSGPSILASASEGPVRGYRHGASWAWRGIPFASPPVGSEGRWHAPRPPAVRTTTLDASSWAPQCMQDPNGLGSPFTTVTMNEDCLYLNVWSPGTTGNRPVMVWIHGGGFAVGTPAQPISMGDRLASEQDVVVVSINYRLGAFGFLVHPDLAGLDAQNPEVLGNYGLLDQIQALRWIQDNIAAFGGDPANVTIFGQSAGGASVQALLASPLTGGLFHRAISESGPVLDGFTQYDLAAAALAGAAFAERANCAAGGTACLMALSSEDAIAAQGDGALTFFESADRVLLPVTDGYVLDRPIAETFATAWPKPGVSLLVGSNSEEGRMPQVALALDGVSDWTGWAHGRLGNAAGDEVEALYFAGQYRRVWQAAEEMLADLALNCGPRQLARGAPPSGGARMWVYWFDYPTPLFPGALHGTEIAFVFRNVDGAPTSREEKASRSLAAYWAAFARTGDPNTPGEDRWDPWPAGFLEVQKRWNPAQGKPGSLYMTWSDAGNWRDDSPAPLENKSALCDEWAARILPVIDHGL